LVLVVSLAGCGAAGGGGVGGGGGGGVGGGGAVPLDRLDEEYAAAFCRKIFGCCTASELPETPAAGGDEAACRATYGAAIASDLGDIQASVASGIVTYDGLKARSCFDTLIALPCTEWGGDEAPDRIPDCALILVGTVTPGGTCTGSETCPGGVCWPGGACVAYAKRGESCAEIPCQGGLYCKTNAAGICAAYESNGATCSFDDACRSNSCNGGVCGPSEICNGI